MLDLQQQLDQQRRIRSAAQRRAAAANTENEKLRAEIRKLRQQNFALQRYIDNPGDQAAYKRRYHELLEAVQMVKDLLKVVGNGLEPEPPTTLEPPRVPVWARVQFKKD